jgi:hypothetical protein
MPALPGVVETNDRCTTTKVYKYLATADVEIRNFRKIRFSRVKIKVIRRIVIHPAIRASYNAFLFGR